MATKRTCDKPGCTNEGRQIYLDLYADGVSDPDHPDRPTGTRLTMDACEDHRTELFNELYQKAIAQFNEAVPRHRLMIEHKKHIGQKGAQLKSLQRQMSATAPGQQTKIKADITRLEAELEQHEQEFAKAAEGPAIVDDGATADTPGARA